MSIGRIGGGGGGGCFQNPLNLLEGFWSKNFRSTTTRSFRRKHHEDLPASSGVSVNGTSGIVKSRKSVASSVIRGFL